MKFTVKKPLCALLTIMLSSTQIAVASAAYPERPITLVVPYAPGGVTDVLARRVAVEVGKRLQQPIVVENKPGGGANIGAMTVARAKPDGYTILMGSAATNAINANLYKNLTYDHLQDFTPVVLVAEVPNILVVNPSLPVTSVKELVTYAQAHPGELNFGSSGTGGTIHLSGELFKSMADVEMTHIPYRGSAPAVTDLLAGETQVMFDSSVIPHIKSEKLRALGVTSSKRSSALPDVPTIAEAGLPGYEATSWFGVVAPAGTPDEVITKLNEEFNQVLNQADIEAWMNKEGFIAGGGSSQDFTHYIQKETEKWAELINKLGLTAE